MPTIRRSHVLIALAVLGAVVGLLFAVRAVQGGEPVAAPSPSASPSPSPAPDPQPKPFRVKLAAARGVPLESSRLYGRRAKTRPKVVKKAAGQAAKTLKRYLDGEFVAAKTRLTRAPIRALFTRQSFKALRKQDLKALGLSSMKVTGGRRGKARVRATVLYDGRTAIAVTLVYRARIRLLVDEKVQPLISKGTLVLAPAGNGWRADMADVRLSLPRPTPRPGRAGPPPEPSEEPTA